MPKDYRDHERHDTRLTCPLQYLEKHSQYHALKETALRDKLYTYYFIVGNPLTPYDLQSAR